MTNTAVGVKAQRAVKTWLYREGIKPREAGYYAPFDLITESGTRIEVKTSAFRVIEDDRRWGWIFNIHRHGKLDESQIDVYILRLEPCEILERYGFSSAVHMVLRAPLGVSTVLITPRSLLSQAERWAQAVNNSEIIKDLDRRFKNTDNETTTW